MTPPGLPDPLTTPLPAAVESTAVRGRVLRGVPYVAHIGHRPLEADVHLPERADPAPVVLFVHGGAWRVGSRAILCPTWSDWHPRPFEQLVAAGFAVVSVDYRLSSEATFPAQLDDVTAALRWIRARADELEVDADRVVLWGESAGAQLAALLGLTATRRSPNGIVGVVDWYGPADFTALESAADPASPESSLLGASSTQVPDAARAASPLHQVHPNAPAFHIAHGTADKMIPAAQSESFATVLDEAGVTVELDLVPGAGHIWSDTDGEPIFARALDFARRCASR